MLDVGADSRASVEGREECALHRDGVLYGVWMTSGEVAFVTAGSNGTERSAGICIPN